MNRINKAITLLILGILIQNASAASQQKQLNISEIEQLKPYASEIQKIQVELGVDFQKLHPDEVVVIVGEQLTSPEKAGMALASAQAPKDVSYKTYSASSVNLSFVERNSKIVVLAGGPSQNTITEQLEKSGLTAVKEHEFMNQFVVETARTKYGTKVLIISDKRGYANMPRRGAAYSPLALCLPLQWIPIAASIIGAFLISLITPVMNIFKAYVELVIAAKGKEKKKIEKNAMKIAGIKVKEILSVIAAAFVLSLAVTWTFAGPTFDFLWLMALNMLICLVAGLSHEILHWIMGKVLKIETEYRFWKSGSFTTLVTAILGNSFGLQGFLLEDVTEETPKWKIGVMKISSPIFSTILMLFFAALNFFIPHVTFQMIYSIAGIVAMVDILPFKPMDGEEVRKWNIFIWLVAFISITASFTLVSFII